MIHADQSLLINFQSSIMNQDASSMWPFRTSEVWCAAPLGAAPKNDSDKPRIIIEITESELTAFSQFIKFNYLASQISWSLRTLLFYWQSDWTDALRFSQSRAEPLFPPFFSHTNPREGGFYQHNVLPFGWKLPFGPCERHGGSVTKTVPPTQDGGLRLATADGGMAISVEGVRERAPQQQPRLALWPLPGY
jgi:hypothetical protein